MYFFFFKKNWTYIRTLVSSHTLCACNKAHFYFFGFSVIISIHFNLRFTHLLTNIMHLWVTDTTRVCHKASFKEWTNSYMNIWIMNSMLFRWYFLELFSWHFGLLIISKYIILRKCVKLKLWWIMNVKLWHSTKKKKKRAHRTLVIIKEIF